MSILLHSWSSSASNFYALASFCSNSSRGNFLFKSNGTFERISGSLAKLSIEKQNLMKYRLIFLCLAKSSVSSGASSILKTNAKSYVASYTTNESSWGCMVNLKFLDFFAWGTILGRVLLTPRILELVGIEREEARWCCEMLKFLFLEGFCWLILLWI